MTRAAQCSRGPDDRTARMEAVDDIRSGGQHGWAGKTGIYPGQEEHTRASVGESSAADAIQDRISYQVRSRSAEGQSTTSQFHRDENQFRAGIEVREGLVRPKNNRGAKYIYPRRVGGINPICDGERITDDREAACAKGDGVQTSHQIIHRGPLAGEEEDIV